MNKQIILDFVTNVIIENGIQNNLDTRTIMKSIEDYKAYLKNSGMADKEMLNEITKMQEDLEEYIAGKKALDQKRTKREKFRTKLHVKTNSYTRRTIESSAYGTQRGAIPSSSCASVRRGITRSC